MQFEEELQTLRNLKRRWVAKPINGPGPQRLKQLQARGLQYSDELRDFRTLKRQTRYTSTGHASFPKVAPRMGSEDHKAALTVPYTRIMVWLPSGARVVLDLVLDSETETPPFHETGADSVGLQFRPGQRA